MTRRQLLSAVTLGLGGSRFALPQQYSGMASHSVTPAPRGKPSGLPFNAKFVNVAAQAGLRAPIVYGNEGHVDYILDAMGCGVAFIDYDNDGWLDVVTLTGRRRTGKTPDDATIRLYRNNRDGTFTRRDRRNPALAVAFGPPASPWAITITTASTISSSPAGARTFSFTTTATAHLPTSPKRAGLIHPGARYGTGCTWVDYDRDGKLDLFVNHYVAFDPDKVPIRGKSIQHAIAAACPSFAAPAVFLRSVAVSIATTETARSPT